VNDQMRQRVAETLPPSAGVSAPARPRRWWTGPPAVMGAGVLLLLAAGILMVVRAEQKTNKVALASLPKPVTVTPTEASSYRRSLTLVGTLRPWVEADVGPQFISDYVDTVLVRPGAQVKRGQVLATLDCRNANAETSAISHAARAIEARQKALADEAARTQQLLSGGFVSENTAEKQLATSTAEAAQLESEKARLLKSSLSVSDCVLRAPFDGEVGQRYMDPGAFVHPGQAIVSVVDRSIVRMTADAPETDFEVLAPNTPTKIHVLATDKDISAPISRRAPAADSGTRTIHFEIDIPDPGRQIPVNTTGEVTLGVGESRSATRIPIYAASILGTKASLFRVEGDTAHAATLPILGEDEGSLYFSPADLPPGTPVVTEGQAQLSEGDRVTASEKAVSPRTSSANVIAAPAGEKPK